MTGTDIKRHFKDKHGIPVRVRKVPVKHPFFQVWIEGQAFDRTTGVTTYAHEFPADLGNKLLAIVYGEGKGGAGTTISFPAGNVQRHSLSFTPAEFARLIAD